MDSLISAAQQVPLSEVSFQEFSDGMNVIKQQAVSSVRAVVSRVAEHSDIVPSMRESLINSISGCI